MDNGTANDLDEILPNEIVSCTDPSKRFNLHKSKFDNDFSINGVSCLTTPIDTNFD